MDINNLLLVSLKYSLTNHHKRVESIKQKYKNKINKYGGASEFEKKLKKFRDIVEKSNTSMNNIGPNIDNELVNIKKKLEKIKKKIMNYKDQDILALKGELDTVSTIDTTINNIEQIFKKPFKLTGQFQTQNVDEWNEILKIFHGFVKNININANKGDTLKSIRKGIKKLNNNVLKGFKTYIQGKIEVYKKKLNDEEGYKIEIPNIININYVPKTTYRHTYIINSQNVEEIKISDFKQIYDKLISISLPQEKSDFKTLTQPITVSDNAYKEYPFIGGAEDMQNHRRLRKISEHMLKYISHLKDINRDLKELFNYVNSYYLRLSRYNYFILYNLYVLGDLEKRAKYKYFSNDLLNFYYYIIENILNQIYTGDTLGVNIDLSEKNQDRLNKGKNIRFFNRYHYHTLKYLQINLKPLITELKMNKEKYINIDSVTDNVRNSLILLNDFKSILDQFHNSYEEKITKHLFINDNNKIIKIVNNREIKELLPSKCKVNSKLGSVFNQIEFNPYAMEKYMGISQNINYDKESIICFVYGTKIKMMNRFIFGDETTPGIAQAVIHNIENVKKIDFRVIYKENNYYQQVNFKDEKFKLEIENTEKINTINQNPKYNIFTKEELNDGNNSKEKGLHLIQPNIKQNRPIFEFKFKLINNKTVPFIIVYYHINNINDVINISEFDNIKTMHNIDKYKILGVQDCKQEKTCCEMITNFMPIK